MTDRGGTPADGSHEHDQPRVRWVVDAAGASHPGRRPVNEDAYLIAGSLFAVADGVGGAPRGDLAARAAVEAVRSHEADFDAAVDAMQAKTILGDIADDAGRAVEDLGRRWAEVRGAATTFCAAGVLEEADGSAVAAIANVGDSRLYLVRNGDALQLTADHTLARAFGRDAEVPGRYAHVVTRVLGGHGDTSSRPDLFVVTLLELDRLVLCTDGVSGAVGSADIAAIATNPSPDEAAHGLIRAAWEAGASDNLSCIVVAISRTDGAG